MRLVILFFFLLINQSILLAQDYNILDFGAAPDGKIMNTTAINPPSMLLDSAANSV